MTRPYKEDLRIILKEMQPDGSGSDTTEPVGESQASLVPVADSLRPASKGEKENVSALVRA